MKCIFCRTTIVNKLEQRIKACNDCVVKLLMKRHNLKVKKQAPVSLNLKKYEKI
jgi:DNA-directed RNA polymerase subunit RPC12/RpoP